MKDDLGALILSKKKIKSGTLIPPHTELISGSNLCLSSLPTGWSQGQQISLLILYKQSNKTLGLGGPRKKIQPHLKSYPFRVSERRAKENKQGCQLIKTKIYLIHKELARAT